jgi:hypothetical protein
VQVSSKSSERLDRPWFLNGGQLAQIMPLVNAGGARRERKIRIAAASGRGETDLASAKFRSSDGRSDHKESRA